MTQVMENKQAYLANFARLQKASGNGQPSWLDQVRRAAIERFESVGFPTTKDEQWRFTNVAPIAKTTWKLASGEARGAEGTAEQFSFGKSAAIELVFVNGQFSPQLSNLGKATRGVMVGSLEEALHDAGAKLIEKHLTRYAQVEVNPFVALNTGFVRDGAFVHLARSAQLSGPIHLLFVSTPSNEPTVSHPRVLVIAEENSEAQIVESYVGAGAGLYFTNAVTEIVAGPNSRIDHCKLQQDTLEAFHVSTTQVQLAEKANFISHNATIGGKLTRNDATIELAGEYAEATFNGLVIASGTQHVDNHTLLRHEKANCPSHELFKYVLSDKATAVFKGKIFVQKDAQKTNAKQTSKSLLLSDDATMDSMPALEIYADDVKCTHGSTTGPVDEDMVFYLRTRGVSLEAARHLLSYAFAADITRRIKVEPVRRRLEDFMAAQHGLPQDLRITDLGTHDEKARG